MFCNKCGSQTNGARFCPNCGSAVTADVTQGMGQAVPSAPTTNGMAIASLITSLVCCGPLGLIFGLIALNQINNSGGRMGGKGLAIAGIAVGAVGILVSILLLMSPDFWTGFNQGYNGY
jgi:Domain of unknown function (DUF4190)